MKTVCINPKNFFTRSILKWIFIKSFVFAASFAYAQNLPSNAGNTKGNKKVDALIDSAVKYLRVDSDSALYYANEALLYAEKINDTHGQAKALVKKGNYFQTKAKYNLAMENFSKAIELLGDKVVPVRAAAYLGLGQIYKDMSADKTEDYIDKGLLYARMAYALYKPLLDSNGMANSLSMAGILYRDKAKMVNPSYYDSAFIMFTLAIKLEEPRKRGETLAKLYNNIIQVYTEHKKDYARALQYLKMAEDENMRNKSLWGLTHNYANMADNIPAA